MKKFKTKLTAFFLSTVMAVSLLSGATAMNKVKAAGTAADVVALAQSQVGYHEKASNYNLDDFTANSGYANYNKYARDIGVANGQAWCATFVWWLMQMSGVPSNAYPSRTTVTRDWFNQRGLYHARGTYTPKPGDYVVFGNVAHCGIVESVSGNYVYTIEGNSSDQVKRNCYPLTHSYILGYGEISYSGTTSSSAPNTSNPGSPYPIPTTILRSGNTGDSVRWVQKFANDVLGAGLAVDGIYGTRTVNVVKSFQSQHGLTVDGIAGNQTISKMLSVWQSKVTASKPLDLGTGFAAIILRTDIWKSIRNNNGNVVLWDEKANAQYYWYFVRQNDGSYMIQSLYDGNVLDVYGAYTANQTKVQTYHQHGADNGAQKWYIYASGNSYKLVPKLAGNMCLDVAGAATGNGTQMQIYEHNGSTAQQFSIYKISHSALQSISIVSGYNKTMEVGDEQTLKCNLSPSNTRCNTVKWVSSDSAILSVDGNGVVTANKPGTVTITSVSTYDGTIKDTITIEVVKKKETIEQETTEESNPEETTEQETTGESNSEETTEQETTEESNPEETTEQVTEAERKQEETTEQVAEAERKQEETTEQVTKEETKQEETTEQVTEEETKPEDIIETIESSETEGEEIEEDSSTEKMNEEVAEDSSVEDEMPAEVGTVLKDVKNSCKVKVTCNVDGCYTVDYVCSTKKKAKKVVIPSSVTIGEITYSVTGIAANAFCDNNKITTVTIGNNVKSIGSNAFRNCKKLKSIVLPASVQKVGKSTFRDCKSLNKITIKGTALKKVGKNAFKGVSKKVNVVVPNSKKKTYKKMLKKAGLK